MYLKLNSGLTAEGVDLADLSERIITGPQERILSLLENINCNYGTNFRATKTFRWRPGFYKDLNVLMTKLKCLDKPSKTVKAAINQPNNVAWRYDRFVKSIRKVDEEMYKLRQQNLSFQDNEEAVKESFNLLMNKVSEESNALENSDSNINIKAFVGMIDYGGSEDEALIYIIDVKNIIMSIGDDDAGSPVNMGSIRIYVALKFISVFGSLISDNSMHVDGQYSHHGSYIGSRYIPEWEGQKFPYASTSYSGKKLYYRNIRDDYDHKEINIDDIFAQSSSYRSYTDEYANLCLGDFKDWIVQALCKGELSAAAFYLQQWSSLYHIHKTGPLNNYSYMYFGKPKALYSGDMDGKLTYRDSEQCLYSSFPDTPDESYCNIHECLFMDSCTAYQEAYMEIDEDLLHMRDQIVAQRYLPRRMANRLETESIIHLRRSALESRARNAETADRYWMSFYSGVLDHFGICLDQYTFLDCISSFCQDRDYDTCISDIYEYNEDEDGYYAWLSDCFEGRLTEPILLPVESRVYEETGIHSENLEAQLLEHYSATGRGIPIQTTERG